MSTTEALNYGPCMLDRITQLRATHTFHTYKDRATPGHQHPPSTAAVTQCFLVAAHFTELKRMLANVELVSAASVSIHWAPGVRGGCVSTQLTCHVTTS